MRYFRLTRDHTVIWSVIMCGHYVKTLPSIKDCIAETRCSKETARRILQTAVTRGYLRFIAAPEDARKKLVTPSRQCIAEFEAMVDGYLDLPKRLGLAPRPKQEKRKKNRPKK